MLVGPRGRLFFENQTLDDEQKGDHLLKSLAFNAVGLALPQNLFYLIEEVELDDAYGAWQAVKNHFVSDTALGKFRIRIKLYNLEYNNYDNLSAIIAEIIRCSNTLKSRKDPLQDSDMLCMLLNSLSNVEEYKPILPVVWNVSDLNFNKARSILENWVEQDTPVLQHYHDELKREGKIMRVVKLDAESTFARSNRFMATLTRLAIKPETVPPDGHAQNKAERAVCTIGDGARMCLLQSGLPYIF